MDKHGFNRWILRVSDKLGKFMEKFGIPRVRYEPPEILGIHQFAGNESRVAAPSGHKKDLPELKERQRDVAKHGPDAIPEAKDEDHRIIEP